MPRAVFTTRNVARSAPKATSYYKPSAKPAAAPVVETSSPNPAAPRKFSIWQAVALGLALTTGGLTAFYAGRLALAVARPPQHTITVDLAQQEDVSSRYDDTARSFDAEVGMSELLMGINRIRKRLARQSTGHVLEVSCGTGRNLGYYDLRKGGKVESLTMVDLSPVMVEVCRKKWDIFAGKNEQRLREGLNVRFMTGDALQAMPLAPAGKKYNTIIQTMGLCSTPTPTALLTNMARYLDTDDPDARVLLLEHGRSYYEWMNERVLDPNAQRHAEEHGCWWNRDIGALVEEAAEKSGLEVVRERRHHFGTTWLFELKAKPGWTPQLERLKEEANDKTEEQQTKASWFGWSRPGANKNGDDAT